KKSTDSNEVYEEVYLIDYNKDIFKENGKVHNTTLNLNTIKNEIYSLNEGDKFYVKLKNSSTTMAGAIFNIIIPTSKKERIVVNYGGIVKNNAWKRVDATFSAHIRYPEAPIITAAASGFEKEFTTTGLNQIEKKEKENMYLKANSACYSIDGKSPNKIVEYTWEIIENNEVKKNQKENNDKIEYPFEKGKTYTVRVYSTDSYGNNSNKTEIKMEIVDKMPPEVPIIYVDDINTNSILGNTKEIINSANKNVRAESKQNNIKVENYTWECEYDGKKETITEKGSISNEIDFEPNKEYKLTVWPLDSDNSKYNVSSTVTIKFVDITTLESPQITVDKESVNIDDSTITVTITNPSKYAKQYIFYLNGKNIGEIDSKKTSFNINKSNLKLTDNTIYCKAKSGNITSNESNKVSVWGYNFEITSAGIIKNTWAETIMASITSKVETNTKTIFFNWRYTGAKDLIKEENSFLDSLLGEKYAISTIDYKGNENPKNAEVYCSFEDGKKVSNILKTTFIF
ncbi:MAG: hypothetical protein RSB67_03510, partial [Clostridia bacterium]